MEIEDGRTTDIPETTGKGKLLQLESLRFLACLGVVFFHSSTTFDVLLNTSTFVRDKLYGYAWPPAVGFVNGAYDVSIFFVLSGYVLVAKYFKTLDHAELQRQCHKRCLRLLPPALVGVVIFELVHGGVWQSVLRDGGLKNIFWPDFWCLVPLWTLPYELMAPFYLLVVANLSPRAGRGGRLRRAVVAMTIICLPVLFDFVNLSTFSLFGIGYYIAEEEHLRQTETGMAWFTHPELPALATMVALHALTAWSLGPHGVGSCYPGAVPCYVYIGLGGASVVWWACVSPAAQYLLERSKLHCLAKLTFPLYLTHGFFFFWSYEQPPPIVPTFAYILICTLLLHYVVERPAMWLAEKYADWVMQHDHGTESLLTASTA